jgi:glutaconate CoA-transferase subunit A
VILISDLGEFDFFAGKMRVVHHHPGISIEQIRSKTGFALDISPDLSETPLPSETDVEILRHEIDPLGIRRLELLGGSSRRELLRQIILMEKRYN